MQRLDPVPIFDEKGFRRRLAEAVEDSPETQTELCRRFGLEPKAVSAYKQVGKRMPKAPALAKISAMTGRSIDWIVFGREVTVERSEVFRRWLKTDRAKSASAGALDFLRSLPLAGREPRSTHFFDMVLVAYESELSPEEAVSAAYAAERRGG